jgi:hypothetical protein
MKTSNIQNSDRVEIEHKYLLTLDPADSQRPKPSPEAKPLPEHLNNNKKVNASNRQDGVPEVGDPFHDPGSEQKWAEWNAANTSEIRNPNQTKVDMSKLDKVWHYLGKTSTEARAQYTGDPRITTHNPKSNFLDTVKPTPARIVAPPQRMSYPSGTYSPYSQTSYPSPYSGPYSTSFSATAGYTAKGAGSLQRPPQVPQQHPGSQQRPQNQQSGQQHFTAKPYTYKPKTEGLPSAPRPFQYGSQPGVQGYPPLQSRAPSVPLHAATSGPAFDYSAESAASHGKYPSVQPRATIAHSPSPGPPRLDNSPPYRNFYQHQEKRYTQPQAMDVRYKTLTSPKPTPPPLATGIAPIANMLGPTAGSFTPPSQRAHSASVSTNESYICHIMKYPYLKNAFLRRPKTYTSPYATGGGFTPEYQDKLVSNGVKTSQSSSSHQSPPHTERATPAYSTSPSQARSQPYSPYDPQAHAQANSSNPIPSQPPRSHTVRYETAQQFQQNVHREVGKASSPTSSKFDFLISQINQATGRPSPVTSSNNENSHPKSNHAMVAPTQNSDSTGPRHDPQASDVHPQPSYSTTGLSHPQPYSLPPLQPWSSSGYPASSGHPVTSGDPNTTRTTTSSHAGSAGMTRSSSGDGHGHGFPQKPWPSSGKPSSGTKLTGSGNALASFAPATTSAGPTASYTPRMQSPERPDYSPLSDTVVPDASATARLTRPPTSMHVQGILSRSDEERVLRQDHYSTVSSQQQHSQSQYHRDQKTPVGLGLEGYKMS